MFARVTRYNTHPGSFDETVATLMALVPRFEAIPEFLGGSLVADRANCEIRSVSYWATKEDAERYLESFQIISATLEQVGVVLIEMGLGEVLWMKSPTINTPEWVEQGWPAWKSGNLSTVSKDRERGPSELRRKISLYERPKAFRLEDKRSSG